MLELPVLHLTDPPSFFTFLIRVSRLPPGARAALDHPAAMISLEDPRGTGSRPKALDEDTCWHKASPSWTMPVGLAGSPPT